VENKLHWVLDVCFAEDQSRTREGHAVKNLTTLRRLALDLLKRENTKKRCIRKKNAQHRLVSFLPAQIAGRGTKENFDASALSNKEFHLRRTFPQRAPLRVCRLKFHAVLHQRRRNLGEDCKMPTPLLGRIYPGPLALAFPHCDIMNRRNFHERFAPTRRF